MKPGILLLVSVFSFIPFISSSQSQPDSLAYIKVRTYTQHPNVFTFEVSNEPPLMQIAGAPTASYSYFWEFGDGHFSFAENPTHVYTDSTAKEKKVVVSLTNNYGSGGAPRLRPQKIKPQKSKDGAPEAFLRQEDRESSPLSKKESVGMFTNHSPRPGDPIVCVLSYQNTDELLPEAGTIFLFYNEKEFGYPNFVFEETRVHYGEIFREGLPQEAFTLHGEVEETRLLASANNAVDLSQVDFERTTASSYAVPLTQSTSKERVIAEGRKTFESALSWEYNNLKPGEKRNIFTTFLCSPQMEIDTAKTLTIRAVVVPENKEKTREYNLKMVIQSSHDPNKIAVSDRKIRKNMIRRNGITYKVNFQNVGKGAATQIRIVNDLHESLDPSTVEIVDYYPRAALCLLNDSASYSCLDSTRQGQEFTWTFKNIYLPGTKQEDRESRKATKGWIEFSVKPKERFHRKAPIEARSLIYFDKNEPIATNRVKTKIEQNWTFGAKAGFSETPFDPDFMLAGASFSAFHPRSFYLQPEVMVSSFSHDGFTRRITEEYLLTPDGNEALGDEITRQSYQLLYFDFVPLQVRKNITPFASLGAGLQIGWLLKASEIVIVERTYYPVLIRQTNEWVVPYPPSSERNSQTVYNRFKGEKDGRFAPMEAGFFLDIQGGLVRKGPSLGIRYQTRTGRRPLDEERSEKQTNHLFQLYLQMRF